MKTNFPMLFNRFLSLLLAVLFLGTVPATVFARSNYELKIEECDTVLEPEDTGLSGGENYTYTLPDTENFLIESVTGAILIENEMPVVEFSSRVVPVPAFDYYKIVDQNGNLRFYQADVLKDPTQAYDFVYIGLYVENGPAYSLHVHYSVDAENKLYNIMVPLTEEQFLYFTKESEELCLGTDAVSQRLKSSGREYTHGTFEKQITNAPNDGEDLAYNYLAIPAALNTVATNSYDSYTDSDGIIHSYESDYFGQCYLEDDWTITDDPIVNIIPKELCFVPGEHIYVGREYGFFIRVVVDAIDANHYAVDVFVFDIAHVTPSFTTTETGSAKVTPLFQYKYRAADANTLDTDVDPALSRVVFPHVHYDYAEYFLKDVGFKISLDNPTALNPDDSGYVASEDNGAFMIQTRVNMSGVGLKKNQGSFVADTAMFVLGFVPYLGTGLSVLSYVHDVNYGFGNGTYLDYYPAEELNNEYNCNTYKTNSTDQIAEYGNLVKSQSVELASNKAQPRLIHVDGGYVEAKYVIARKSGSTYNEIRVVTSISVSIVEDNTSVVLGMAFGELDDYGRGTGTYETGAYKRLNDISLNGGSHANIPANSQINVVKIVPKVSGTYKLFTDSQTGDPHFCITNATTGSEAVFAIDDIDGANDRNAMITLNLVAGNVYYLGAFRYGTPSFYTVQMGYNPTATETLILDTPHQVIMANNTYEMLEFTPDIFGYYRFSTSQTSGDPQLFLFSDEGTLLHSDDDSAGNLNAVIECYLPAGTTYYIAVQGYNGNAATFSVIASEAEPQDYVPPEGVN